MSSDVQLFRNETFMLDQSQGVPQLSIVEVYEEEEDMFLKSVTQSLPTMFQPMQISFGHTQCTEPKSTIDSSFTNKVCTAPHSNYGPCTYLMQLDCYKSTLVSFLIFVNVSTRKGWCTTYIEDKREFLRTKAVDRDVFFNPQL